MAPDKDSKKPRDEFEVEYYTKELGRTLQRKMLQKRLDDFTFPGVGRASHGEEPAPETRSETPRDDRAG